MKKGGHGVSVNHMGACLCSEIYGRTREQTSGSRHSLTERSRKITLCLNDTANARICPRILKFSPPAASGDRSGGPNREAALQVAPREIARESPRQFAS